MRHGDEQPRERFPLFLSYVIFPFVSFSFLHREHLTFLLNRICSAWGLASAGFSRYIVLGHFIGSARPLLGRFPKESLVSAPFRFLRVASSCFLDLESFPVTFLFAVMFVSFCFDDTISRSVLRCFLALLFRSCVDTLVRWFGSTCATSSVLSCSALGECWVGGTGLYVDEPGPAFDRLFLQSHTYHASHISYRTLYCKAQMYSHPIST